MMSDDKKKKPEPEKQAPPAPEKKAFELKLSALQYAIGRGLRHDQYAGFLVWAGRNAGGPHPASIWDGKWAEFMNRKVS